MQISPKLATGTALGVAGAYSLAPDLTTLTMHYFALNDASLPFQVVDAWTRAITAGWSLVVTLAGSALAAYLPAKKEEPIDAQV